MNFDRSVFSVFENHTLEDRMEAIRNQVQPSFQFFAEEIAECLQAKDEKVPYIHIAKHLRRTTYPPESTWVAIGGNKRGYKKYPHFQIGINKKYVFIVLALIDNPLYEKEIAEAWRKNKNLIHTLSKDFIIIPDHTKEDYQMLINADYDKLLQRVIDVKKAEFMIGRLLPVGDEQLENTVQITNWLMDTVDQLYPLYKIGMNFYE